MTNENNTPEGGENEAPGLAERIERATARAEQLAAEWEQIDLEYSSLHEARERLAGQSAAQKVSPEMVQNLAATLGVRQPGSRTRPWEAFFALPVEEQEKVPPDERRKIYLQHQNAVRRGKA